MPAHATMSDNVTELVDVNIAAIDKVFETILELCGETVTLENLLKKVFDAYGMQANIQQFALIGSTLRSYLTNLLEQGKVNFEFVDNTMYWKKNI